MARSAFYSGSFDPITNGHLDVIVGAAAFCDRLTVGVGTNPNKAALFSAEERLSLILDAARPALAGTNCALDVVAFSGLGSRRRARRAQRSSCGAYATRPTSISRCRWRG